jgi:hypothetical protein
MIATHFQLQAQCEMFMNVNVAGHNNVSFLEVIYCTLLISFRCIFREAQVRVLS